jgi:DNA-binding NarL/FixJ family response regulator
MNKVRILIADDHELVREGLRSVLAAKTGWVICGEAVTGREAVAKAIELRPNVAILDFAMPELNGLEAARKIRKAVPKTEVMMLTVYNTDRLVHDALTAGVKGFILKTDAKRYLVSAVEALSQHQAFFTPGVSSIVLTGYLSPETRPASGDAPLDRLTQREREVLHLIAEGKTSKEMAATLGVSEKTVETHRANLLRELNLRSAIGLVRYAIRNKLIEP